MSIGRMQGGRDEDGGMSGEEVDEEAAAEDAGGRERGGWRTWASEDGKTRREVIHCFM